MRCGLSSAVVSIRSILPGARLSGIAATILTAVVGLGAAGWTDHAPCAEPRRAPNVVLILADDLGWAELGCYGNTFNETPHIDRLARQGVRFTHAYASAPVCSPDRASLLTGQYPARVGIVDYLRPESDNALSTDHVTLAEALQRNGYATGIIGKWHLTGYRHHGAKVEIRPTDHGFDEELLCEIKGVGNGANYFPYVFRDQPISWLNVEEKRLPGDEYLVDRMNDEAVRFIERHRDRPFFLYLSHYAVHTILNGKKPLVDKYRQKHPPGKSSRENCYLCQDSGKAGDADNHWAQDHNPHLAAMLESIDQGVGLIAAKLEELGLSDNTILVFTSDNGGETNVTSNTPLRAGKSSLYEGGIRVPLVVHWPKVVPAGRVCHEPTNAIDLYPTLIECAGARPDLRQHLDGVSILPLLKDPAARLARDALYWHYPLEKPHFLGGRSSAAIRQGPWKLIEFFDTGATELYNLEHDPSEQENRLKQHPDRAAAMKAALFDWRHRVGVDAPSPGRKAEPVKPGGAAAEKHDYPLAPMPFNKVTLKDRFWLPRLKTQKDVTVPFALEKTQRAVENLRRCGNFLKGRGGELPFPHRFVSSDLYKVMEGAAYLLMIDRDPKLEKQMDEIIDIIGEAQQEDGYLYVAHSCKIARPSEMGETPYSWVVHSHELYNVGHMYEGAVAYYAATGKDKWMRIAEKSAQHVNKVFFEGDPNYNQGKPVMQAPGHQEIELALCKLYRATGRETYLQMAKRFLDIRGVTYCPQGEGTMSPEYAQQHKPVREQDRAVGHAVRAAYLYAGMADVAALTGDMSYTDALDKIWHNIVNTKMHITGGLGAVHGIEGFGPEYVLPNKNTYDETCAAVANVFFNFRMYLLHKDAKFFDVAEVALLNNSLAGFSISGDRFFYVNPLEADGIMMFNHGNGGRSPWFDCACCPSNLARLMPQVSGYMYAHTDNEVYLTLYGGSQTTIPLGGGPVAIRQTSDYPFDGKVLLELTPAKEQAFALKLRIPSWVYDQFVPGSLYHYIHGLDTRWSLKVNGQPVEATVTKGFATIERAWKPGDTVELNLPMPVRYNGCVEQVAANIDRLAITRGPLVYCAEAADNGDGKVQRFFVAGPADQASVTTRTIEGGPLDGVVTVTMPAEEITNGGTRKASVTLVPYYAWNNRGDASMIVWFPRNRELAAKGMLSNLLTQAEYGKLLASHTYEDDTVAAISDGREPKSSADASIPRWTSLPQKNRHQKIAVDFPRPRTVGSVSVYWADDGPDAQVCLPRDWWLEYKTDGQWIRMKRYITDFYGLKKDTYNFVRPEKPLPCDGLRLNVLPQQGKCVGILEMKIGFDD